jgi:ferredoxin
MPKVVFVNEKNEKTEVEVVQGDNLRQAALAAGLSPYKGLDRYLNCRGLGLCGTCRVLVKAGADNLTPKSSVEKANLNFHPLTSLAAIGHENDMRLSCQVQVLGDCTVELRPALNLSGENFWQKPYPNK